MQNDRSVIARQLWNGVAYSNSQRVVCSGLQSDKQFLWLCLSLSWKSRGLGTCVHGLAWFLCFSTEAL